MPKKLTDNKRRAFISGNFNILHPGHLRLMRFAAEIGDELIIGVNPDNVAGVSVPIAERLQNVESLSIVTRAVQLDKPIGEFLSELKPDFVIKGKEFENMNNVEQSVVENYGGNLIFGSDEMQFSSLALLESECTQHSLSGITKSPHYLHRHNFSARDLVKTMQSFAGVRLLVIGDLIVDDYITCEPLGMSQEDPTIVVRPLETKRFVGGAGVTAAHAQSFGAKVTYMSICGNDEVAEYSKKFFEQHNIDWHRYVDDTRPTTLKQRYRASGKTLLRVSHLRQHDITHVMGENLLKNVESKLDNIDFILFSDFNYGCLPQFVVDGITQMAKVRKIPMGADSQASSQLSDISRFKDMLFVSPTEHEARLALKDSSSGLAVLASKLAEKANVENVLITLGCEGMLIHGIIDGKETTDRLPAFNLSPKDVAGAGDSLFISVALAMANGTSIWQSAYLGAIVAAIQTGRVGNAPFDIKDVYAEINDGS